MWIFQLLENMAYTSFGSTKKKKPLENNLKKWTHISIFRIKVSKTNLGFCNKIWPIFVVVVSSVSVAPFWFSKKTGRPGRKVAGDHPAVSPDGCDGCGALWTSLGVNRAVFECSLIWNWKECRRKHNFKFEFFTTLCATWFLLEKKMLLFVEKNRWGLKVVELFLVDKWRLRSLMIAPGGKRWACLFGNLWSDKV